MSLRVSRTSYAVIIAFTAALISTACAVNQPAGPATVAERLKERTGTGLLAAGTERGALPPGVSVQDGLTQDEAVAIALWNNPDFQVSVSELGFARADLLEAGLLRNPVLSLLFPVGPKQLEATLKWPVEVLWERPRRVAAARFAADAAGERLVQTGLDLAASVKTAYVDFALAQDRQRLADETAALLQRINELTQSRLAAGDISELEARAARTDAAVAQQDALRARHDVTIGRDRLRGVLGYAIDGPAFSVAAGSSATDCGGTDSLLRDALISRPDVRAAELGVEAAAARIGWERSRILTLVAVLDANGSGREGFEMGPGIDVGFPIFDRNQGGRARAAAELERASSAYVAAQHRVAVELREASAQFEQARESQAAWRDTIVSPLQENVAAAERSFAEGESSYLFVLENARRLSGARSREREFEADLQRARARIERAIGRACARSNGS